MAIDSRNKRFSFAGFGEGDSLVLPDPDGSFSFPDRFQLISLYPGIVPSATIDTRDERFSLIGLADLSEVVLPNPDGSFALLFDRRQLLGLYRDEPTGSGIAGIASSVSSAAAYLGTEITLEASVAAEASSIGLLVSGLIDFNAAVSGEASSVGAITTAIRLQGMAAAVVVASGGWNSPPILVGTIAPTFTQGTAGNYSVSSNADDPDGDTLVAVLSPGPTGLQPGIVYNQALQRFEYDGRDYGLTTGQTLETKFHRISFDDSFGMAALARVHGGEAGILTQSVAIAGSALAQASVVAALTLPNDLLGFAAANASANAILFGGSGLEVIASGAAAGSATLTSVTPMAAIAVSFADTIADFFTQGTTALNAVAVAQSATAASLTTQIRFAALAQAEASNFARLGPDYIFFTVASGIASANARLTAPGKKGTWDPEIEGINTWIKELAA